VLNDKLAVARKEMDEATAEDNRLASPGNQPAAQRATVTAKTNPAAPVVERYKTMRKTRFAGNAKLDKRGEELGLGHLTDAMKESVRMQTAAAEQAAKAAALDAALPGGGAAAVSPDEYLANFTAPTERATVGNISVFSNSAGVTRADAEFTAGLIEHFNMTGVENLRIDESPTATDVSVGVIGDQLVMVVPTLPKKMTAAARQAKIAEALGRNIFNRYLRFDSDYLGAEKAQQYRAYMEKAYLRDTGRSSVDEKAFRQWFGEKTAAHVKELVKKTKYTETDEFGNPAANPQTQTSPQMERKVPGITERPNGVADRIFRELAGKIHAVWKKAADKLAKYKSNRAVDAFLNRVVREDTTSTWWDTRAVDGKNATVVGPVNGFGNAYTAPDGTPLASRRSPDETVDHARLTLLHAMSQDVAAVLAAVESLDAFGQHTELLKLLRASKGIGDVKFVTDPMDPFMAGITDAGDKLALMYFTPRSDGSLQPNVFIHDVRCPGNRSKFVAHRRGCRSAS